MSDYDRGAYTPPTEESFAFDARTPKIARPAPATLLGSVVVLVVLVGAVIFFYWSGTRGANEAPQAVGKPQMQIKTAAIPEAKPLADDKLDVYDEEKGQTGQAPAKPAFAPAPEQPKPVTAEAAAAPAPTIATPAVAPTTTAAPATPRTSTPAPSQLATTQKAPTPAAPVKAAPAPLRPSVAPARDQAVDAFLDKRPDKPAKAEPAAAEAVHGVAVQIGAFASAAIADEEFAKTKAAFAAQAKGKAKHVERVEVGGKTFYRAQFTGFDRAGAKAFCQALIAAQKHCIVK